MERKNYVLPDGKVLNEVWLTNVFDVFRGEVGNIIEALEDALQLLNQCVVPTLEEYKAAAAKRGTVYLVRDNELTPVDVIRIEGDQDQSNQEVTE